ncbi:MAG TPA: hypothetical protein VES38_06865 [Methylotenera sp.]|nr:hypothetical protein [Methylotenera sp.]
MNLIFFILGIYLVLESLYAAQHLDKGGRVCQFTKYGASFIVGLVTIYYSWHQAITWQFGWAIVAIAASMWPSTFYRFSKRYNRRSAS